MDRWQAVQLAVTMAMAVTGFAVMPEGDWGRELGSGFLLGAAGIISQIKVRRLARSDEEEGDDG